MSIYFGPGWYIHSTILSKLDEPAERTYVETMVAKSASAEVRRYYESEDGGQVYVKAGRHSSPAETRVHITLQLGMEAKPYSSTTWPARTAHVIDIVVSGSFPTDVFANFTGDSKKKIAALTTT